MRKALVLLVIAAQLGVLGYMAGQRETIREHGQRLWLRTAPIDPRDPFRGDYVRLEFALNTPTATQWRVEPGQAPLRRGSEVFARLRPQQEDLYGLDHVALERPASGLYLAGRTVHDWHPAHGAPPRVKYGIEQYFVEQGRGLEIEQRRGRRDALQIPLEVEVAVGSRGTAVLRGYRWSRLGIHLEILEAGNAAGDTTNASPRRSPRLRLSLHNVSDAPLALADPGRHCSFHLRTADDGPHRFAPSDQGCKHVALTPQSYIRLQPQAHYAVTLDLADPRWHVRAAGQGPSGEIGEVAPQRRFRLVYRTPPTAQHPELWRGELPSPAFNSPGRVD